MSLTGIKGGRRLLAAAAAVLAACGLAAAGTAAPANAAPSSGTASECRTVTFPVTLPSGAAAHISGEYCAPARGRSNVIQFLVHGGVYNHTYWDWSQEPGRYSYVRKAVDAGYAVLAVDRLGDGASSRPSSTEVNRTSEVSTLHQVITEVRAGALGNAYHQVEWVGHSYGSYYGEALSAAYPRDIDAYLLTGTGTRFSADVAPLVKDFTPANFLHRFATLDPGYVTSKPGTRADGFYYLPDSDPDVIAHDEATEDTITESEETTRPANLESLFKKITVPTMIVNGNHDVHYCTADNYDCSRTTTFYQQLAASLPPSTCLAAALEEGGHDLQLQRTAPATDATMLAWSKATIPPHGRPAHCAVRGPVDTPGIRP